MNIQGGHIHFSFGSLKNLLKQRRKIIGAFEAYRERGRERGSFQADNWIYKDRELGSVRIYWKKEEFIGILMGPTEKIKDI